MAKARINEYGEVVLKMDVDEAAGLYALMSRVDENTNPTIHDATFEIYYALENAKGLVHEAEWPTLHDDFMSRKTSLVDLQETESAVKVVKAPEYDLELPEDKMLREAAICALGGFQRELEEALVANGAVRLQLNAN